MSTSAHEEFDGIFRNSVSSSRRHPEDSDDRSDASSDHTGTTLQSTSADEQALDRKDISTMPTNTYIPSTQFDANTGPKGVIADARSFELAKKRSFRQTIYAFASGESPPFFTRKAAWNREKSKSPTPDVSDEDDEFMRTWRAKRLEQLSNINQETRTRRQSPSKRRYGSLMTVDPAGYLDAIEKVPLDTVVVVLIYDDESSISNKVEDALRNLACKHPTIRFVKLHFLEAEMNEIAAPGILAYRDGDCFANLVSMINEIPAGRTIDIATVENILQQHRIIL